MCLQPSYQGCGLGRAMLNRIKNIALQNGCLTLTLVTEPTMKAYGLYSTHGLEITAEHQVDL
jgi:GNAT superfamily N-acetyltransferase